MKIKETVQEYLKRGGKIKKIKIGVSGEKGTTSEKHFKGKRDGRAQRD